MGSIIAFSYVECVWPYIGTSPAPVPLSPLPDTLPPLPPLPSKEVSFKALCFIVMECGILSHHCISWPSHYTDSVLYLGCYGICDSLVHNTSLCCFERDRKKNTWAPGAAVSHGAWNGPLSQESVPSDPRPWTKPSSSCVEIHENAPDHWVPVLWILWKSSLAKSAET